MSFTQNIPKETLQSPQSSISLRQGSNTRQQFIQNYISPLKIEDNDHCIQEVIKGVEFRN